MPLDSNHVYWWRLLLNEYGPKIVHIKSIHNTVANAISWIDFGPVQEDKASWMMFMKYWYHYTTYAPAEESTHTHQHQMNMAYANHSAEDAMYPLTVKDIA